MALVVSCGLFGAVWLQFAMKNFNKSFFSMWD